MSSIDSVLLAPAPPALRLLDQVRARIRVKHYSIRTEETYVDWIRRFVLHFGKRHPRELWCRWGRIGGYSINQYLAMPAGMI